MAKKAKAKRVNVANLALIVGPEGSGSSLVSRIIAHVVGATTFDKWKGLGNVQGNGWKVMHRSLPSLKRPRFYDIEKMIRKHKTYALHLVLTTRDVTMAQTSAMARFPRTDAEAKAHTERARDIMAGLMRNHVCLVWSYETFVFLGDAYLERLYAFLGVESDFPPPLYDANKRRLDALRG